MIEQVATAFASQDYRTAAKLIKQLLKQSPENLWVQFYLGQLQEVSGKHQDAEKMYMQLLRSTNNLKILAQAREGMQRLQDIKQAETQQVITQAKFQSGNTEIGVLVLEPVSGETKTQVADKFAQIMHIDPYTAISVIPNKGWRIYRSAGMEELQFYGKQLKNAGIPCFWVNLSDIRNITVFQVCYFTESVNQGNVVCRNALNQIGILNFDWAEVEQRVLGLIPIFEEGLDFNIRGKLERTTKIENYIHFCDLHLPSRSCILRIYDHGYEFQQGAILAPLNTQSTMKINWNNLLEWLEKYLPPGRVWSEFAIFTETILGETEVLHKIPSNMYLFDQEKPKWDPVFHLYSGLAFKRNMS
ncbi:tetratricopeptide repeat protein [Richelia intracellularis]|nr:tetratricopeptide repeat protein [Richelia intracellularis]HAE05840.1 tetratricopeptide repeat protein [Richelia sp.]